MNSKLKFDEIGVKSNSRTVAFVDTIGIPAAAKVASKLASPVHSAEPSSNLLIFGPGELKMSPVLKITPLAIGNVGLVFSKKPIPFVEPKSVPVRHVIFVALIHGLLINILFTN